MSISVPVEPSVDLQPLRLPGGVALGDSGMGALTEGTGAAADALHAAQLDLQRKRNATKVFEAEVALADMYRPAESAALERRGSSAYGVTQGMQGWWETEPHKILDGLENEAQREMFSQSIARRRATSLDSLSQFESREVNSGLNAAAEAAQQTLVDQAAANYATPGAVADARQQLLERVDAQLAINSVDLAGPEAEAARMRATTRLHTEVIENMIDADPEGARAYFNENKGEIAGSEHDKLQREIQTSDDLIAAQRLSDDIYARNLTEAEALAAARKESEGEQREVTLQLLRQRYQEADEAYKAETRAIVDNAWTTFSQAGIAALSPSQVAELRERDPQTLIAMQTSQFTPHDAVQTDWSVYFELSDMAQDNPAAFSEIDLRHRMPNLNRREYDELAKWQGQIREGGSQSVATLTQIMDEVPFDSSDREEEGLFRRRVREQVEYQQGALKRSLTDTEMREIVDRQLMEVRLPRRGWFDATRNVFELTPEEREQLIVEYDAIPVADRAELEADMAAEGIAVSPENVTAVYAEWLRRGNQ